MSIINSSTQPSQHQPLGVDAGDRLVEHRIHRGQLAARTDAGRHFVSIAESLVEPLAASAAAHDRDGA